MNLAISYTRLICAFVSTMICTMALAESGEGLLNKLLSPGPLLEGHKDLEHKDCFSCHDTSNGLSDDKCLDCHKDIKKSILAAPSFHSLTKKSCVNCHADHKGRDYDSTKVDAKSFNHQLTGYQLVGKHADIACSKCHTTKRTQKSLRKSDPVYLGLSHSCSSCHIKDDIHFFKGNMAKKECSQCHSEKGWDENIAFNHSKDTDFKLLGAHARQTCEKCHLINKQKKQAQYEWPNLKSSQCLACHKDQHQNNLSAKFKGGACDRCHGQSDWKITNFDHKITQFVLRGKHGQLQCHECHKQSSSKSLPDYNWAGLKSNCETCHKDYHGFSSHNSKRFGALVSCQHCHNEQSWKQGVDFNHNSDTSFRIDGKHSQTPCFKCHIKKSSKDPSQYAQRIYQWSELQRKTCETCHKSPHAETESKFRKKSCSSCHVTQGWNIIRTGKGVFNHDTETRFPLDGKHASIKCSECHQINKKEVYKFPNAERQFCITCHKSVHEEQFSPKFVNKSCAECHTTQDFKKLRSFNHDKTRFKITGKHQKLYKNCTSCHVRTKMVLKTKPPRYARKFIFDSPNQEFCVDCHKNVHEKQFSAKFRDKACGDCHSTQDFRVISNFDHNMTRFKLTGEHLKREKNCKGCHKPTKNLLATKPPKNAGKFIFDQAEKDFCVECHNNVHVKQFHRKFSNMACNTCHTTQNFTKRLEFDHDEARFDIRGKHKELTCQKCHTQTKILISKQPKHFAHRYVFPDLNKKDCQTCHKDPHKGDMGTRCSNCHSETAWKKSLDFHKNFSLKGIHYTLTCEECHVENRALAGLSENCLFCHRKDDVHSGSLPNCIDCHYQYFWEITAFRHSMSTFPLRGAHRGLECYECHSAGLYQGVSSDCRSCHAADAATVVDPPHTTASFFDCEECHNQFSFIR